MRLRVSQEFAVVLQWITESRMDRLRTLEVAPTNQMQVDQGYCQALRDILDTATQR